jgi:hypothetical protein
MSSVLTFRKGAYIPGTSVGYTTSGINQQSLAFSASVSIVRVAVNQDTYVSVGTTPTATANSLMMPAGSVEFFAVAEAEQIAFLQVSTPGRISVTELA